MAVGDILGLAAGTVIAGGGVYIAIHETRRREHKVTRREINDLIDQVAELGIEVGALQRLLLEQRRYIYRLVTLMVDLGMDPPPPPAPSFDPGEYDKEDTDAS